MKMPSRMLAQCQYQLDTNRINSRNQLKGINILEAMAARGVIQLELSETAVDELQRNPSSSQAQKANEFVYTETLAESPEEQHMLALIQSVLFPGGVKTQQQVNDTEIVFNAFKYGYILITNDGDSKRQPNGILGNKAKLKKLGINVMRDEEAIKHVERHIRLRDKSARFNAKRAGLQLPSWVDDDLNFLLAQLS